MKLFCILLSWISGLVLLASAFVYLVDSKQGELAMSRILGVGALEERHLYPAGWA